jgi:exosortase
LNLGKALSPSALLGVYTVALLAANVPLLKELFVFARDNDTASHVVVVPLVTLVLLFQDRAAILVARQPHIWAGLAVIASGLMALLVGRGSESLRPDDALSIAVAGLVLLWVGGFLVTFGWQSARAALFPLFFLIFAVPPPDSLVVAATDFLKRGSTETVAALFALTGTPVHREGFVFSLPSFVIEVADECSGIRSSIALMLTGLLACHTFLRKGWTKAVLILAVLPIAVLKNGIRIVALTLLAIHVDPSFLVGQLHHEGGVVFFLMALAMMAPLLPLLRKLEAVRVETPQA